MPELHNPFDTSNPLNIIVPVSYCSGIYLNMYLQNTVVKKKGGCNSVLQAKVSAACVDQAVIC